MNNVKLTDMFVAGRMCPVLRCNTNKLEDALSFLKYHIPGIKRRIEVGPSVYNDELFSKLLSKEELVPVYNNWSMYLSKLPKALNRSGGYRVEVLANHIAGIDELSGDIKVMYEKIMEKLNNLMLVCSERYPSEFNYNGNDPTWVLLGDTVHVIWEDEVPVGLAIAETFGDYMKVWTMVIDESVRSGLVLFSLAKSLIGQARLAGIDEIRLSTDASEVNPFNNMLDKRGLELKSITYRDKDKSVLSDYCVSSGSTREVYNTFSASTALDIFIERYPNLSDAELSVRKEKVKL